METMAGTKILIIKEFIVMEEVAMKTKIQEEDRLVIKIKVVLMEITVILVVILLVALMEIVVLLVVFILNFFFLNGIFIDVNNDFL